MTTSSGPSRPPLRSDEQPVRDADSSETSLFHYTLGLADDALISAQRMGWWISRAPELEEDVALANIGLDQLGQARTLLAHAGQVEGAGRTEDDLAYLREERAFTNCQLVELENGDFAVTMVRQLLFSAYQYELYRTLESSTDSQLAAIAAKAVKESAYHVDHGAQWTVRLGDGTDESHARMQAAVDELWPYTHELFEDEPELRSAWLSRVEPVLAEATLERPVDGWAPRGGRDGQHTEALSYLLAEMQVLHRAHPGAKW